MPAKPRPLAMLYNRTTRYEVGLYRDGKLVDTLAFTARHSGRGLLLIASEHVDTLRRLVGADEISIKAKRAARLELSHGLAVAFTGATERDRASAQAAA